MIFTPWFYMQKHKKRKKKQYDNISILLKTEMELRGFLSKNEVLVGVRGRSPRKLMEFMHLQCSSMLKMTQCSMFCLCFILHNVKCKLMQYDSISLLLKQKWYFMVFYPQMWRFSLPDLSLLRCLPYTHEAKVRLQPLLTSNTILDMFSYSCPNTAVL